MSLLGLDTVLQIFPYISSTAFCTIFSVKNCIFSSFIRRIESKLNMRTEWQFGFQTELLQSILSILSADEHTYIHAQKRKFYFWLSTDSAFHFVTKQLDP